MRLINTRTLRLHHFTHKTPSYAILSHRWRDGEATLQEFVQPGLREHTTGFAKIQAACLEARNHGLDYIWVDTCCIDKTSSAELGEAINSMFKWYQKAVVCFAFLDDVPSSRLPEDATPVKPFTKSLIPRYCEDSFARSSWFTRGWTLQELIAPRLIHFYDKDWGLIGEKHNMTSELHAITGINNFILQGGSLEEIPAGKRISWAADREATREEDMAYSLFGIFNVNLPLVYGEGHRAFLRLQEQILYKSNDHTLLAWRGSSEGGGQRMRGLLAESPRDFRHFRKHSASAPSSIIQAEPRDNLINVSVMDASSKRKPLYITSKGIEMTCGVQDLRPWAKGEILIFVLNCCFDGNPMRAAGIYLKRVDTDRYARIRVDEIADIVPEGRHIKLATIQAFLTTGELPESHLDEPWTTSYSIRRRLSDDATSGEAEGSCRQRYSGAFYLKHSNRAFHGNNAFGAYSLVGILLAGHDGQIRTLRIGPDNLKTDLVLPASEEFHTVLVFHVGRNDLLLVVLATEDLSNPEKYWLEACFLPAERLTLNSLFISESVKEMKNWSGGQQQFKELRLADKKVTIGIGFSLAMVEGLRMQAVMIYGPRPISYLRLPMPVVVKLTGNVIFTGVTLVLLWALYSLSPEDILNLDWPFSHGFFDGDAEKNPSAETNPSTETNPSAEKVQSAKNNPEFWFIGQGFIEGDLEKNLEPTTHETREGRDVQPSPEHDHQGTAGKS